MRKLTMGAALIIPLSLWSIGAIAGFQSPPEPRPADMPKVQTPKLDYCEIYGEADVLCQSQRMQRKGLRSPRNIRDAQIAIDRVKRLIEICDDGKGDVSACYKLCNEGLHFDVCSTRK